MKWVIWYYKPICPGRKVLKVWSRDLWDPPLVAGMEPIDCEAVEVDHEDIHRPLL